MVHTFIKMLKRSRESNRSNAFAIVSRQSKSTYKHPYVTATSDVGTVTPDTMMTLTQEQLQKLSLLTNDLYYKLIVSPPPPGIKIPTNLYNKLISELENALSYLNELIELKE